MGHLDLALRVRLFELLEQKAQVHSQLRSFGNAYPT